MTLQHIVLFSFPGALSTQDEAELRAMVASWPREIGLMTKCRLGADITGARTRGYSHLFYTEFPDFGAMSAYREHPAHQAFLAWLNKRDCVLIAFDYVLDDRTVLMPE